MLCKGCGKEIGSNNLFCPNCGFKNDPFNMPQNTYKCVICGKEFPEGHFFCDSCGGKVEAVTAKPYVSTTQQNLTGNGQNNVPPQQPWNGQNNVPPQQPWNGQNNVPPQQIYNTSNMVPPNIGYVSNSGKKKNKSLWTLIIIFSTIIILANIVVFGIPRIKDFYERSGKESSREEAETVSTEDSDKEANSEDSNNDTEEGSLDIPEGETSEDTSMEDNLTDDYSGDNLNSNPLFSYNELPDVISLDSVSNFSYYDYFSSDGVYTYQFLFNDISASEDMFYSALDDYSILLQDFNGFIYEQDFSEQQYAETGELTNYLTRDDYCITITASVEDYYYAYVSIIQISDQANEGEAQTQNYYPNYMDYILGRDNQYFNIGQEVEMDNGVAFYLNDIYFTDLGDGTMVIDVNIDLASYYSDSFAYLYDFLVLPMDSGDNILTDACTLTYIIDNEGKEVFTPISLSTETYVNYTMTFTVPVETSYISFYGTNMSEDGQAGQLYSIDITLE